MQKFNSDGVEIAFSDQGEGPPVLLVHGFASNSRVNWEATGWIKTLIGAGYRAIAIDNRGHGASEKLYDPQLYSAPIMADDAARLVKHLGLKQVAVMGYSMGARIAAFLTMHHSMLVSRLILAGLAERMVTGVPGSEAIAEAMEAASRDSISNLGALAFRVFADQTKSDRRALAACIRSSRVKIKPEALAKIACPVLVVAGELDDVAGPVQPLVDIIPGAQGVVLPGRNHMNAVGDKGFKNAALAFLAQGREAA